MAYKFTNYLIRRFDWDTSRNTNVAYHYTSPGAFLSILQAGHIRFSDIDYMNDKSESIYAYKMLIEYLDAHPDKYLFTRDVLNTLIGEASYQDIKDLRISKIQYCNSDRIMHAKYRNFLFCLSTKQDSLNMWNYYVQNNQYQGYNMGIDIYEFLKTFEIPSKDVLDSFIVYYGKVVYKKESQLEIMGNIVERIEKLHKPNGLSLYDGVFELKKMLDSEGLFIKHPEFSSEQEFRIVVHIAEGRIPHNEKESQKYFGENNKFIVEDFCVKGGLIVPFLKVRIPCNAITKVTVSPITEYELAQQSIQELLSINGYTKATVEQSKIPIRF